MAFGPIAFVLASERTALGPVEPPLSLRSSPWFGLSSEHRLRSGRDVELTLSELVAIWCRARYRYRADAKETPRTAREIRGANPSIS